jgi:hypothetical protein
VHGTSLAANARHGLYPEELASGDVDRSREVIAAAAQDLAQHERWLKSHLAAEARSLRQFARVVRREEARERRRGTRRRLARSGTRIVVTVSRSSRSIRRSLLDEAAYGLGQLRHYTLLTAAWVMPRAHAASSWTRRSLAGAAALTGTKARALTLTSASLGSAGLSRGVAGARALASVALRATSSVAAETAARGPRHRHHRRRGDVDRLCLDQRARSRNLARASLEKASIGGSWLAARAIALAGAAAEATSSVASSAIASGQHLALTLRRTIPGVSARAAAKLHDLASFSAEAAAGVASSTVARTRGFASHSRRAAAIGAASGVATACAVARDVRSGASVARSWLQTTARSVSLELRHASAMASPWVRGTARDTVLWLLALRSAARRAALRQSERAALIAVRLRARVLVESDALSRVWRSAIPVRR